MYPELAQELVDVIRKLVPKWHTFTVNEGILHYAHNISPDIRMLLLACILSFYYTPFLCRIGDGADSHDDMYVN